MKTYKKPSGLTQVSGDGKTVEKQLEGAERIYSRADTKIIITMAKAAQSPGELMELGKVVYNATKSQDKRAQQEAT